MKTWHLLALLTLGCGARDLSAYVQDDTDETLALRAQAATTWDDVGVITPGDYALGILPSDLLQEACETRPGQLRVNACTFIDERVILISETRAAGGWSLLHELGHLTRGRSGHLQCDQSGRGPDVMCPKGQAAGPVEGLTERDVAFALGE